MTSREAFEAWLRANNDRWTPKEYDWLLSAWQAAAAHERESILQLIDAYDPTSRDSSVIYIKRAIRARVDRPCRAG